MAVPLGQESFDIPANIREIVIRARTSWLKNADVLDILLNFEVYGLTVGTEAPVSPPGGSLFLFNRKIVRFFRKDGHEWRKKSDGKTVRETHEKLKIDNKDVLNCYYAHSEAREALQRRCYWLLEEHGDIVLVHYLSSNPTARLAEAVALKSHRASSDVDLPLLQREPLQHNGSGFFNGSIPVRAGSDQAHQSNLGSYTITTGESLLTDGREDHLSSTLRFQLMRASSSNEMAGSVNDGTRPTSSRSLLQANLQAARIGSGSLVDQSPPSRASSIGLLHALPLFSNGVVQTGSTIAAQDDILPISSIPRPSEPRTLGSSQQSDTKLLISNLATDATALKDPPGQISEKSKRAREFQQSSDRISKELNDLQLQPAASLTRVNSDTLLVAPSVSGATSGKKNGVLTQPLDLSSQSCSPKQCLPSTSTSPFYAAAFTRCPIVRSEAPQGSAGRYREGLAHSAPVGYQMLSKLELQRMKRAKPEVQRTSGKEPESSTLQVQVQSPRGPLETRDADSNPSDRSLPLPFGDFGETHRDRALLMPERASVKAEQAVGGLRGEFGCNEASAELERRSQLGDEAQGILHPGIAAQARSLLPMEPPCFTDCDFRDHQYGNVYPSGMPFSRPASLSSGPVSAHNHIPMHAGLWSLPTNLPQDNSGIWPENQQWVNSAYSDSSHIGGSMPEFVNSSAYNMGSDLDLDWPFDFGIL